MADDLGARPLADALADAESPVQRMFLLLDHIASRELPAGLPELTLQTGLAKATVHRMLHQLEEIQLVIRDSRGRYGTGPRLRRLARSALLNDSRHAARHRILAELVDDLGESCNITALVGDEVCYLDRVETSEPLRFTLGVGSRVPAYASASGKLLLGQLGLPAQRRILRAAPLRAHTPRTLTDPDEVEREIALGQERGYALDDEEFLPGLVCAAVPVPPVGRSNLCVAVQAPALRFSVERAARSVERLQRAARAIAAVEDGVTAEDGAADVGPGR